MPLLKVPEPAFRRLGDGLRRPYGCLLPVVDMLEHRRHPPLEGNSRLPPQQLLNLGNVCMCAIWFTRAFGDVGHLAPEQCDETLYTLRLACADIHDLLTHRGIGSLQEGISNITDEGEVTCL